MIGRASGLTPEDQITPEDAAELAELKADFGICFYFRRSDMWRATPKDIFLSGRIADTASGLREQLDTFLIRAIPELKAQLAVAEAAAARLEKSESPSPEPDHAAAV
jgi:hypothetical protein